jgi:hypothetical protein
MIPEIKTIRELLVVKSSAPSIPRMSNPRANSMMGNP